MEEEDEEEEEEEEEESTCTGPCCKLSSTGDQEQPRGQNYYYCCCHYDPFEEEEQGDESLIRDPSFALRKLRVMECQMRKWRLERLQLESQARSLSLALQARGVDVQKVFAKTDPLMAHYRTENQRLERRRDELEDEVRDLRETLAERDCCEEQPCDAVAYVREKILSVRLRAATEKKQLRETISDLRVKLKEAQEESSCAALNSLRSKLRELAREGRKAIGVDQQTSARLSSAALEKSIETMAELTTSCDELKRENERLLAEVESLKKEIRADEQLEEFVKVDDLEASTAEITELSKRVRSCESTVTQMRLQLAEKDETINDLQKKLYAERRSSQQLEHDLDQTLVSRRGLAQEIEAMRTELDEKDQKVSQLMRDLRESMLATQTLTDLESELERLRPEVRELETQRDEVLSELSELRRELSARNDQIIQLLEERDRQRATLKSELEKVLSESSDVQAKYSKLVEEGEALRERVGQLENELETRRRELEAATLRHQSEIEDLRSELSRCRSESVSLKDTKDELRRVDQERRSLLDKLSQASANVDRLTDSLKSSESEAATSKMETTDLREAMEEQRTEAARLEREKEELSTALKNLENDSSRLQEERAALQRSLRELEEKLAESRRDNEATQREIQELANRAKEAKEALERTSGELRQVKSDDESSKRQLDESRRELEKSQADVEVLRKDKSELKSALDASETLAERLRTELDSLSSDNSELLAERDRLQADRARLGDELETSENRLVELQDALAKAVEHKDRLEREIGDLKWQLDKLRKDLEAELTARKDARSQLEVANAEVERLKSRIAELENAVLGAENDQLKSDSERLRSEAGKARKQSIHLRNELANLQSSNSAVPSIDGPSSKETRARNDASKPKEEQRRSKSTRKDKSSGDSFAKASEALKSEMQSQIEGVNRVRGFVSYVEGKTSAKPKMATESARIDRGDRQSSSQVNDLFESSAKLSEAILKAEIEIQSLEKLASPAIDELGSVVADKQQEPVDQISSPQENPTVAENNEVPETASSFAANAWLQSLTLTELAELHDRICLLTSSMVQDDEEAESRELLNARMAALQRQIAEKQREAELRADEMNRALMREQAQLIRISDEMNRERELNLAIGQSARDRRLTPEEAVVCCAREDCLRAGCTGDFDPRSARRK